MARRDQDIELTIASLLRMGVFASAFLVSAGGLWYLFRSAKSVADYRAFHGEPPTLCSVGGILHGLLALDARSLIQFGLLVLIGTPLTRVGFSVVAFAARRDGKYFALTVLVLAILAGSLFGLWSPPH